MSKKATLLWMAGIFLASSYLSLVNLDNTALWYDESTPAFMGENLWRNHTLSGWNGRTLYVTKNGTGANSDLMLASFAPWPAFPSALGVGLFGANEFGTRIFHTLLGLASLLIFWQLLRLDFAARPRLRVLAFALFALSTQVILFMRIGRYVQDAFFFTFLSFYAYRLYIAPGGRGWHLTLAAAATVLNFLNHFAIGASFACALAAWHCIYHFRQTTARQWMEIGIAGAAAGGLCLSYLIGMGIIFSDEELEFARQAIPFPQRQAILVAQNFRDLPRSGALPLWVALWFAWFAFTRSRRPADDDTVRHLLRWTALLALFLLFSGLFSVGSPTDESIAPTRWTAPALAFTALITAAFVDYLWQQRRTGRAAAIAALLLTLNTNFLSYPLIYDSYHAEKPHYILLPNLLREVHTARRDGYIRETLTYLGKHAQQDETIYASHNAAAVMQFYLSHKLIFCCLLNEYSPLPEEKVRQLGAPLYEGDAQPDWIVIDKDLTFPGYERVYTSRTHNLPTHRPDMEYHTFAPLHIPPYQHIHRKMR